MSETILKLGLCPLYNVHLVATVVGEVMQTHDKSCVSVPSSSLGPLSSSEQVPLKLMAGQYLSEKAWIQTRTSEKHSDSYNYIK